MSRLIAAGAVVYDQPDFYSSPGTRATGVVLANLSLTLFVNNGLLSWPLEDGSAIADSSITASDWVLEISTQAQCPKSRSC